MGTRSRATFMNKLASKDPKTITAYKTALDNFERYCKENKIKKFDEDDIQEWVNYLARTRSPRTVLNMYSRIRKYCRHLKIILDEVELPSLHEKELYPLTLEEIHQIFQALRYHDVTLFMAQLSGGLRIGEVIQLRKKDLHLVNGRYMVKIPHMIAKFKRARTTFFSSEVTPRLSPVLQRLNDNDLVFGTNENPEYAKMIKETNLNRALEKTGLDMRYDDTNWHKINTHSFRAYFITKVSRIDPNMAKKLSGEKGYLLQYDRMTNDEYLEFYERIESELFIFDLTKKNKKILELQEAKAELEIKNQRIDELEKKFELYLNPNAFEEYKQKIIEELNDPDFFKKFEIKKKN